jgi:hypothetical protein
MWTWCVSWSSSAPVSRSEPKGHDAPSFDGIVTCSICGVDSVICQGIPLASWRSDRFPFCSHLKTVWAKSKAPQRLLDQPKHASKPQRFSLTVASIGVSAWDRGSEKRPSHGDLSPLERLHDRKISLRSAGPTQAASRSVSGLVNVEEICFEFLKLFAPNHRVSSFAHERRHLHQPFI